jgi:hypothetical protein
MQARCGGHRRRGRTPVRRTGCRTAAATCWLAMRWRAPAAQPPPWAWSTHRGLPRPCSRRRRLAPRPPAPPTAATSASSSVSPRQIRCPSASTRGGQDRFHRGDPRPLPMHLDLVIEVASVSTPARGWPARWTWRCGAGASPPARRRLRVLLRLPGGKTNQWYPAIYENTIAVEPWARRRRPTISWPTRRSAECGSSARLPRTSRSSCTSRPAPPTHRITCPPRGRQVPGQVRSGLGPGTRGDLRSSTGARRHPCRPRTHRPP